MYTYLLVASAIAVSRLLEMTGNKKGESNMQMDYEQLSADSMLINIYDKVFTIM